MHDPQNSKILLLETAYSPHSIIKDIQNYCIQHKLIYKDLDYYKANNTCSLRCCKNLHPLQIFIWAGSMWVDITYDHLCNAFISCFWAIWPYMKVWTSISLCEDWSQMWFLIFISSRGSCKLFSDPGWVTPRKLGNNDWGIGLFDTLIEKCIFCRRVYGMVLCIGKDQK